MESTRVDFSSSVEIFERRDSNTSKGHCLDGNFIYRYKGMLDLPISANELRSSAESRIVQSDNHSAKDIYRRAS